MQRHFFKRMNTQKLQSSVQCSGQVQLLVQDGDHQVNRDGNPDLGLHRVGTRSVVVFDAEGSFDPAKEQLDAPSPSVNQRHRQRRDFEWVGQKRSKSAPSRRRSNRPCATTKERSSCRGSSQNSNASHPLLSPTRSFYVSSKTTVIPQQAHEKHRK